MRNNMSSTICIIHPNKFGYTETFVGAIGDGGSL